MLAGKDHVIAATLKERVMSAAALVTPEPMKAEQHRRMAEPDGGAGWRSRMAEPGSGSRSR